MYFVAGPKINEKLVRMRGLAGYKKTDAEPQSAQFTVIDTSAKKKKKKNGICN